MKYLDCMEMLNYGLQILKENQRVQVPVSKLNELLMVVTRTTERLKDEQTPAFRTTRDDIIQAISVIQDMKSVKYMSDNMKNNLVDGVETLKLEVAKLAYEYYSMCDFEPTKEIIPIMRDVVRTYSLGGGKI